MSITKNVPLKWYYSVKKKIKEIRIIFDIEIDFESQNFAIFTDRFQIGGWSARDLLQWESAIYHSIKLGFEGQVAKKFLNGI